jgi:hypothetical protein
MRRGLRLLIERRLVERRRVERRGLRLLTERRLVERRRGLRLLTERRLVERRRGLRLLTERRLVERRGDLRQTCFLPLLYRGLLSFPYLHLRRDFLGDLRVFRPPGKIWVGLVAFILLYNIKKYLKIYSNVRLLFRTIKIVYLFGAII